MIRHNKVLIGKILLVLVLLGSGLAAAGCVGLGAGQLGWSGATIADGTIFVGSVGKLVALNTSDGSSLWEEVIETSGSTGGFGCAVPAMAVTIYGTPAVDGDLVFAGGYDGKVYAYSTDLGSLRWVYPREGNLHSIVGGLVAGEGMLYFGTAGGIVYALDATTGDRVWQFENGGEIWSTPAMDGDTLYIGSFDEGLYAIDATTGEEKWAEPFETRGPIITTPLVYNDIVYIGSFDRHFYAIDVTNGQLIWQFPDTDEAENKSEKWFWASPVVYNNTIYAPSMDGWVYVLDAESGTMITMIDLGSPISSSPAVVNDKVVMATEEGKVFSIDTVSHQEMELRDLGVRILAPLVASDGIIYVHTQEDEALYAYNTEMGATVWDTPLASE